MHRLFVALRPPSQVRAPLLALMEALPGARWQSDEQLHLTLRFIGEVDRHRGADIAAALGRVGAPGLTLAVEGLGMFESRGRPNSVWAGLSRSPELVRLLQAIDRALDGVGLPRETRAFRPHITLARLGRLAAPPHDWLADRAGLSLPPATFAHLYLYESTLGSEGSVYTVVERYPLG